MKNEKLNKNLTSDRKCSGQLNNTKVRGKNTDESFGIFNPQLRSKLSLQFPLVILKFALIWPAH